MHYSIWLRKQSDLRVNMAKTAKLIISDPQHPFQSDQNLIQIGLKCLYKGFSVLLSHQSDNEGIIGLHVKIACR